MTGTLALREAGREVTVCCGGHRPASDCLCCAECVTNAVVGRLDPALRALVAHDDRERWAAVRTAVRRAQHAVMWVAWDDSLRDLTRATLGAVAVLPLAEPGEVSPWFRAPVVAP